MKLIKNEKLKIGLPIRLVFKEEIEVYGTVISFTKTNLTLLVLKFGELKKLKFDFLELEKIYDLQKDFLYARNIAKNEVVIHRFVAFKQGLLKIKKGETFKKKRERLEKGVFTKQEIKKLLSKKNLLRRLK